ncbi:MULTISPECIES: porin [Shewanella]|nr:MULTISPECIES: porin [Shewanella]QYJ84477.1 OprO/OprP family phosphate-selective porin [Shewanella aegiceratis]QYJ92016.1 OprO/OprP family phosphate-selective porin [Shewanella halotolerans]QYJ95888.1 OprO/OprP family phosphate-selective porin [Shewanella spartinae]QYJ99701.1 OprO/OprP family phosphate-selective porin [Shewanella alkalitolerans]TVP14347.1 porin [Shewanella sp. KCT]
MKKTLIAAALVSAFASQAAIASDETQELRKVIEQQQKVLKDLEKRLEQTEQRVEKTADAVEESSSAKSATTIGGYGELHYNNITDNKSGKDKKEFDFHRFVLFFGHEFTEKTRFFSELEVEHSISGEGQNGEVELEQAYIEHDFNDMLTAKAGLFLMPVGIINETHEPPAFYGVERNPVEKNILPATWWEAGANLNIKAAPGLAFDAAVTSGLNVGDDYKIRGGRQKVSEAKAEDLAYTARVKYTAVPGLELAATVQYQSDLTQGRGDVDTASATLMTAHAIYTIENFTIKALYAQWDIDGKEAEALGRDKQKGYYIEPSYRFNESFGVFARYNAYDNEAGNGVDSEITQTNVGVNYWLHENVVFKADYEKVGGAKDADGFNLGVGYQF